MMRRSHERDAWALVPTLTSLSRPAVRALRSVTACLSLHRIIDFAPRNLDSATASSHVTVRAVRLSFQRQPE